MGDKKAEEEILSIPFIGRVRDEANKTIDEELKKFRWDIKQWEVSDGQVRHIITAYKLLREKEAK